MDDSNIYFVIVFVSEVRGRAVHYLTQGLHGPTCLNLSLASLAVIVQADRRSPPSPEHKISLKL